LGLAQDKYVLPILAGTFFLYGKASSTWYFTYKSVQWLHSSCFIFSMFERRHTYFTASLQYGTVQQETLNKEQPTAQKASQTRN
jgi:hypothetical protein